MGFSCKYPYETDANTEKVTREKFIEENMNLEGIKWGVFYGPQDDLHIIPVDTDGNNFEMHVPNPMCSCHPKLKSSKKDDVRFVFAHQLKKKIEIKK